MKLPTMKVKMLNKQSWLCGLLLVAWCLASSRLDAAEIQFNRDVRPILANHCWNCHGPDEQSRQAGLRLDLQDHAQRPNEQGLRAIVPGDSAASQLIARIEANDDRQMPPADFERPLSDSQKQILKQWIQQGAAYATHWAFASPARPKRPAVQRTEWPRNDLDWFVLQRIEQAGLAPSPEADRSTWLRRVTLDLTGFPPTPEDRSAFLADESPSAYERVVDRLLQSPRYAERMAMHWLDAARYADTNGYNNDELRTLWPWRDWVINAFSRNLSYDQFITEQLAGDLLPDATLAQKVATGFNRNHVLTTEGGIIEEEYRVEYVADRVHTTATVFLALSLQCARCHDHKYDPFSMTDYYRFAGFFNNIPDKIVGYSAGRMAEPLLQVPTAEQQTKRARLTARIAELAARIEARPANVATDLAAWEASLTTEQIAQSGPAGLVAHFPLDETAGPSVANLVARDRPGTVQGSLVAAAGKLGGSLQFDVGTHVVAGDIGRFDHTQGCSFVAWVFPTGLEPNTVLSRIDESDAYRGYDVILEQGKVASHFVHRWPDRAFKVMTRQALPLNEWHHLVVTYDGSQGAKGLRIYVDGKPQELDVTNDGKVDGTLITEKPFHIGLRQGSAPFRGRIDDVRVYSATLSAEEAGQLARGESLADLQDILAVDAASRTPKQIERLRAYYLQHVDPQTRQWKAEQAALVQQSADLEKLIPVTMVMGEMTPRRATRVLTRGQYDQPGAEVEPGVLRTISDFVELPNDAATRLDLARWLTHPHHPLTARVAVNRWWEMLFGTGIVETLEDFGGQGALPSHPELLDSLATQLIAGGWNTQALLKQIVLSATYRQSSRATLELIERDPRNRLLARGPRYRLPAEVIRDNSLAISGLLVERTGGPSVKPYQPAGLWEDVSVERREKYTPDVGEGLYRRSMYTFWKRTCPPPGMSTFDAPDRETCVARRARTNTPLQALVLLNDPTYIEASRRLAEHVVQHALDEVGRIDVAFQLAVCRPAESDERAVLLTVQQAARRKFEADRTAAELLLSIGHAPRAPDIDVAELAAWTTVCSLILNLDETISKP